MHTEITAESAYVTISGTALTVESLLESAILSVKAATDQNPAIAKDALKTLGGMMKANAIVFQTGMDLAVQSMPVIVILSVNRYVEDLRALDILHVTAENALNMRIEILSTTTANVTKATEVKTVKSTLETATKSVATA